MKTECLSDFFEFGGKTYPCSISLAMDLIGGKWKAVILHHLQGDSKRFSELRRHLTGVTEAMLSNLLKELEHDGLIARRIFGEKPPLRSAYSLTAFGRTVLPVLAGILDWGNQVVEEYGQFVFPYDAGKK